MPPLQDFTFIVGFAIITGLRHGQPMAIHACGNCSGEMRTVAGDGDAPVADLEGIWEAG